MIKANLLFILLDVKRVVNLTYGSKQLIAHEIELEKMRR